MARPRKAVVDAVHPTRETEIRSNTTVHEPSDQPWVRPASLEAPPPRKGMVQRWIRVGVRGKDDATNASRKFREGWQPRKADTVPTDFPLPRIESGRFAGCIGVEGSILCEMPVERNEQRNKYYADIRDRATQAINDQLENASAQAGHGFGRISKVEKTTPAREVAVADDE